MKRRVLTLTLMITLSLAIAGIQAVKGNPFGYYEIIYSEGYPYSETKPPTVSITSPTNNTSYSSNSLSLTCNISIGDSSTPSVQFLWNITFEGDWLSKNMTIYDFKNPNNAEPTITEFYKTLNLTGIPEGPHSLRIYTRVRGAYEYSDYESRKVYINNFFIDGSSSVIFTVDLTSPTISFVSVENKTYYTSDVLLKISASEVLSKITYSIDGYENVTTSQNTILTNLSFGEHYITVYGTDEAGNTGASETIFFTIEEPEQFSIALVIIMIFTILVVIGIFSYLKHKKRKA